MSLIKSLYFWGFTFMNFASCTLAVSSENWFVVWVGAELSTLFFVATLASFHSDGYCSWVVSWKYLVFQSLGSALIFLPLTLPLSPLGAGMLLVGLSVKLGIFPFHGWVFYVLENSSVGVIILLSSIQKIPSLLILLLQGGSEIFLLALGISALGAGMSCIHSSSVKFIFGASSVLMTSWLSFSCLIGSSETIWFFLLYSVQLACLLLVLPSSSLLGEESLFELAGSKVPKLSVLAVGAVAGLPPFSIFFMKLQVVSLSISSGQIVLPLLLIFSSAVMLAGYIKVATPSLLGKKGSDCDPLPSVLLLLSGAVPLVFLI